MAEGEQDHNSGITDAKPTSLSPGVSGSATLAEGENVNLKFTKSTVNVVARDQINANKFVYNINIAEGEAPPASQDISKRKLIQICNDNTRELTAIDMLEDFRLENLQEPDFKVYPQMREVDVKDYYKGRYDNIRIQLSQGIVDHNQLRKEVGFFDQDNIEAKMIGIDDIVASIWKREKETSLKTVGVTAIVASAGSGKSTLTRRIARQGLGISAKDEVEDPPSFNQKMVHFIELKGVTGESEIKPSTFLFGGLYQNEEDEVRAFEWLVENQSDAIIIFDGLDQARWEFDEKSLRKIRIHEKASSWTVMYNILSRNILRHVKIYIASREFKVSELPAMARPETIITLNGLTLEDAHRLFAFLLKEEGEDIWQKIETMSPRLLNLVSVPVFLILTAVVMERDLSKPPPATVTELYNRIILTLQSVENIRNRKEILSIVNKLKALAFRGMEEGRVMFKETDMEQFGVTAEEVQDLMTKVPGNNLLSRYLMQGDFTFFFCHQSIQEYLAAIFVTEMEYNEFCRFDEEHLHEERWSVVRRFVAGVVFSKSQNELYRVSDRNEKQHVLDRSIRSQLEEKTGYEDNHVRMELYTAIYESGDDSLMKQHSVINASEISITRDKAHVVGALAARYQSLDSLILEGCSIDDELLGIIARCLENRIYVKEVDLRANNFSATALRSLLGHRRIESLSGNLDWQVVKLTVGGLWFELKTEENVIKISGEDVAGHFNIKDSTLSFHGIYAMAQVGFFGILFDAIKYNEQRQLLATQDDLRNISECKFEKISKILLDCTENGNIDWPLIETTLEKYDLENLDIAVNGQISDDDYYRSLKRGRTISVFDNIHAMFCVGRKNDFRTVVEACHHKKIEYIRCTFSYGHYPSLDEISSLVKNSNLQKVILIYLGAILEGEELRKAQKIANDLDTELEVLKLTKFIIDIQDAWQRLDYEFYHRKAAVTRDYKVAMGILQKLAAIRNY